MGMPICHCSRCHSRNTIRVDAELLREHWYCYACGHGFEVSVEETRSAVSLRPKRSEADSRSARVK